MKKKATDNPGLGRLFDTSAPLPCPLCGAVAVVPLPPYVLAQQKDGTTHVCFPVHPWNGCNHGFTMEASS